MNNAKIFCRGYIVRLDTDTYRNVFPFPYGLVVSDNDPTMNTIVGVGDDKKIGDMVSDIHVDRFDKRFHIFPERVITCSLQNNVTYVSTVSDDILMRVELSMVKLLNIRPSVRYLDMSLENALLHLDKVTRMIIEEQRIIWEKGSEDSRHLSKNDIETTAKELAESLLNIYSSSKENDDCKEIAPCDSKGSMKPIVPPTDIANNYRVRGFADSLDELNKKTSMVDGDVYIVREIKETEERTTVTDIFYIYVNGVGWHELKRNEGDMSVPKSEAIETDLPKENKEVDASEEKPALSLKTIAGKLEFVTDCETLSLEDVATKYGMEMADVIPKKYQLRAALKKSGVDIPDLRKIKKGDKR